MPEKPNLELITSVVASYVERNKLAPDALAELIGTVAQTFATLGAEPAAEDQSRPRATAAQIRRSITPEALISFEDGRPYKMLRRHLSTLGLTPEEYRAKWGLAADYPMTAPGYSAKRSAYAKAAGLGQRTRRRSAAKGK